MEGGANLVSRMDTEELKRAISTTATEIRRLHSRIHETVCYRDASQQQRDEWENACAEFHARYDMLAFPDGYDGAVERIIAGDPKAVEAAICFLELRPCFFRSGYMFSKLLRKVKRAPLSPQQADRLRFVIERQARWRSKRLVRNAT